MTQRTDSLPGRDSPAAVTDGREVLEIAGLLLALGGAAWLWAELTDRLRERVAKRLERN